MGTCWEARYGHYKFWSPLGRWIARSPPRLLARLLARSPPCLLAHPLARSPPRSLARSLARPLARPLALTLPSPLARSLARSPPRSVVLSLAPTVVTDQYLLNKLLLKQLIRKYNYFWLTRSLVLLGGLILFSGERGERELRSVWSHMPSQGRPNQTRRDRAHLALNHMASKTLKTNVQKLCPQIKRTKNVQKMNPQQTETTQMTNVQEMKPQTQTARNVPGNSKLKNRKNGNRNAHQYSTTKRMFEK